MGTNNDTDLYWGSDEPVWDNERDGILVLNPLGQIYYADGYGPGY